jgi:hypothetical protein
MPRPAVEGSPSAAVSAVSAVLIGEITDRPARSVFCTLREALLTRTTSLMIAETVTGPTRSTGLC